MLNVSTKTAYLSCEVLDIPVVQKLLPLKEPHRAEIDSCDVEIAEEEKHDLKPKTDGAA